MIRRHWPFLPIILLLAALQIYAFRWGVILPDTVAQYAQALSGQYDDWHPPVTAWLWRQLIRLQRGSAPFLILDVLLYWSGLGLIAAWFLRRQSRLGAILTVALGMLPIPFGQMGAILKDSLLAASMLMAAGLALQAEPTPPRDQEHVSDSAWPVFWRIASLAFLILASATRFNSVFAAAPVALLLTPSHRLRRWPVILGAGIAATIALATASWLIDDVALKPRHSGVFVSLLNFDLAGIAVHGGGDPYPPIASLKDEAMLSSCYSPRLFNPRNTNPCNAIGDALGDWLDAHHIASTRYWLEAVATHPIPWAWHRIDHLNWNWRAMIPEVPRDAVYVTTTPNDLGLAFRRNPIAAWIERLAYDVAVSPFGRPATWIATALGLLVLSPALPSRRVIVALCASTLFYGGAYAVVSVAPDMRYNLWTLLSGMLATICVAVDRRALRNVPTAMKALAALPTVLMIAAELIAIA